MRQPRDLGKTGPAQRSSSAPSKEDGPLMASAQGLAYRVGGLAAHARQHVRVGVKDEGDGGVSQ